MIEVDERTTAHECSGTAGIPTECLERMYQTLRHHHVVWCCSNIEDRAVDIEQDREIAEIDLINEQCTKPVLSSGAIVKIDNTQMMEAGKGRQGRGARHVSELFKLQLPWSALISVKTRSTS